ncbi:MAG TPA: hypothetical protein VGH98_15005 [Gemmatimonadaceae bacterium]
MMRPALTPDEWCHRRSGTVFLDIVDDETHIVVADPDEQLVSVTGPNELHALAALANDALPPSDPRKLTGTDLAVLSILVDRLDRSLPYTNRLVALADALNAKISALLPP